jgi:hypothetical protein
MPMSIERKKSDREVNKEQKKRIEGKETIYSQKRGLKYSEAAKSAMHKIALQKCLLLFDSNRICLPTSKEYLNNHQRSWLRKDEGK